MNATIESDNRWISRAARLCLPLVELLADGRMSWADRELYSSAIRTTIEEARSLDSEVLRAKRADSCRGQKEASE